MKTIIEILKDNTALGQSNDLVDQGRAELATELLALLREKGSVRIDIGADIGADETATNNHQSKL
ncbi:MAG: hypothetical protein ACPGII_10375 [Opitutales bacterium]